MPCTFEGGAKTARDFQFHVGSLATYIRLLSKENGHVPGTWYSSTALNRAYGQAR